MLKELIFVACAAIASNSYAVWDINTETNTENSASTHGNLTSKTNPKPEPSVKSNVMPTEKVVMPVTVSELNGTLSLHQDGSSVSGKPLQTISADRARIGAFENQLSSIVTNLEENVVNSNDPTIIDVNP